MIRTVASGLAMVLGAMSFLACSDSDDHDPAAGATVYVGEVYGISDAKTLIGVHAEPRPDGTRFVRAYVCDGRRAEDGAVALWFTGTIAEGEGEGLLEAPASSDTVAVVIGESAVGTVHLADGKTATFDVPAKADGSGIYDVTVAPDLSVAAVSTTGDEFQAQLTTLDPASQRVTGVVTLTTGETFEVNGKSYGHIRADSYTAVGIRKVVDNKPVFMINGRSGSVRLGEPTTNIIMIWGID